MAGDLAEQCCELLEENGELARLVPGFRPRAAQIAMARSVAQTIEAQSCLVVEAGTGTGKTYAYLLPALLSSGKVLIRIRRSPPLSARASGLKTLANIRPWSPCAGR